MPNLHPLFTHFPIALLTTGFIFDLLGVGWRKELFERIGWWLQLSGTLMLYGTVATGLIAGSTVQILGQTVSTFEIHQQLAFAVSALASALLLWRIANKSRLPKKQILYIAVVCIMLFLLWAGAWYGGELVYRFGVGVQYNR